MPDRKQQLRQSAANSLIIRLVAHFVHAGGLANKVLAFLSPDCKQLEPVLPSLRLYRLCDGNADEICSFTTQNDKENTSEDGQGSALQNALCRFLTTAHSAEFFFYRVCQCVRVPPIAHH